MNDVERNEILVKIVEKLAEMRGIIIDAAFERDGLGELITEALRICEGEVMLRPQERLSLHLLIRRWRASETRHGFAMPKTETG